MKTPPSREDVMWEDQRMFERRLKALEDALAMLDHRLSRLEENIAVYGEEK